MKSRSCFIVSYFFGALKINRIDVVSFRNKALHSVKIFKMEHFYTTASENIHKDIDLFKEIAGMLRDLKAQ